MRIRNDEPYLFNAKNGIVDLRTGELRGHRPEDFIKPIAGVEVGENADCPKFKQFVMEAVRV